MVAIKTDENIVRARIACCEAGHPPPRPTNKKWEKRNSAIKTAINSYRAEQEKNKQEEENSDQEEDLINDPSLKEKQWKESIEYKLLMAVAHNSKL